MSSATAWHATAAPALKRLAASAGPTGVILGRDHSGALAPVRLLRAEPHFDLARRRTPELNQPYSSIDSSISMTGMSSSTM